MSSFHSAWQRGRYPRWRVQRSMFSSPVRTSAGFSSMRVTARRVSSSTMRSISGCPPGRPSALARWFASRASRAQRFRSSRVADMAGSCAFGRRSRRDCALRSRAVPPSRWRWTLLDTDRGWWLGWRLASAARDDTDNEANLEATCRETATVDARPEHDASVKDTGAGTAYFRAPTPRSVQAPGRRRRPPRRGRGLEQAGLQGDEGGGVAAEAPGTQRRALPGGAAVRAAAECAERAVPGRCGAPRGAVEPYPPAGRDRARARPCVPPRPRAERVATSGRWSMRSCIAARICYDPPMIACFDDCIVDGAAWFANPAGRGMRGAGRRGRDLPPERLRHCAARMLRVRSGVGRASPANPEPGVGVRGMPPCGRAP